MMRRPLSNEDLILPGSGYYGPGGYPFPRNTEDRLVDVLPSIPDENIQAVLRAVREREAFSTMRSQSDGLSQDALAWLQTKQGQPGTFTAITETEFRPEGDDGWFFRKPTSVVRTKVRIVTT